MFETFFLSLFQGVAEFLPISSSGHLLLLQKYFTLDQSLVFTIFLHVATMLAILVGLRKTLFSLGYYDIIQVGVALLPLFPLVLILSPLKKVVQNGELVPYCFILGGSFLLSGEWALVRGKTKRVGARFWVAPLLIGVAQAFAVLPGISRLGTTIAAALWLGFSREKALYFSLVISIPAVLGATAEELLSVYLKGGEGLPLAFSSFHLFAAFTITFLSGLVALQVIQKIARSTTFNVFGYYCIVMGILSLILL